MAVQPCEQCDALKLDKHDAYRPTTLGSKAALLGSVWERLCISCWRKLQRESASNDAVQDWTP